MRRITQPWTRRSRKRRCPVRCSRCRPGTCVGAFGVFYKEDKYEYAASPVASVFLPDGRADIQGFSASKDIQGDDHNVDVVSANCSCRCSGTSRVSNRWRRCWATASPTTRRLAASTPGRRSCSTSRSRPAARAAPTSRRCARRASTSSTCRNCRRLDFFFFEDGVVEPCDATSAARSGPDAARVEALCLEQGAGGTDAEFADSDESCSGSKAATRTSGPRRRLTSTLGVVWTSRSHARRVESAGVARLVPDRDHRQDMACRLPSSCSTATTPATTRTSRSRTSGARCSGATRDRRDRGHSK